MAKKVIDIFPPRDSAANIKTPAAPAEEIKIPGIKISASEPLSRLEPESAAPQPEIIPGPPIQTPIEPGLPPLKPRVTFMGQSESSRFDDDDNGNSLGGKIKGWAVKLILAGVVVAAIMYAIDWKTARAMVKIWPATSELSDKTRVIVDPAAQGVNEEKGIISGLILTVEDTISNQSDVTGKKDTQGKATGTVKIFNNYTTEQRLVKNTRLEAEKSKFNPPLAADETPWFRTTQDIVLPPKSSATVTVIADRPGEKYNIEPAAFSVPGLAGTPQYIYVIAQSYEKFQGGSTGSAPLVTQADLDNAKQAITDLAKSEMEKKLRLQVPEGYEMVAESQKYDFGAADVQAKLGDSLGKITSQMTGKATAVVYRKSDLDNMGKDFILSKVPQGSVAYQPKLEVSSAYEGLDPVTGNAFLELSARVPVYPGLEDNELKKGLSERSGQEAKMFLEKQGMKVEIKFTPIWRNSIPRDLDRIEVQTIIE